MQTTTQQPQMAIQSTPTPQKTSKNGKKPKGCMKGFLIALIAFLGICFNLMIIAGIFGEEDADKVVKQDDTVRVEVKEYENVPLKRWLYEEKFDEMTDAVSRWANIVSDNYIEQEFPYNGETYAIITVRYIKKYGTDVMIRITKGQIAGNEYYGNNFINVRFGKEKAKKYYFNEAADGSSDVVFLSNPKDFIERCKKTNEIKIEIPIFQSGNPLFKFHVDESLIWS